MALGGTEVQIPVSILTIVGDTRVLGVKRTLPQSAISGNMLSAAKAICAQILQGAGASGVTRWDWVKGWFNVVTTGGTHTLDNLGLLLPDNGDAELWMHLCSLNNPPPVRVVRPNWDPTMPFTGLSQGVVVALIDPSAYGSALAVGNERPFAPNALAPLGASNLSPWCVSDDNVAGAAAYIAQAGLPHCPPALVSNCGASCWGAADIDRWATRGAINAGLAVYTYVDSVVKTLSKGGSPPPTYDGCEQLK
jgi:hypothetical protein